VIQHSVVHRRWVVAASVALALAACAKGDRAKTPDSTAAPATASAAAAPALPGALTKPLEQYSGDELFALTRQLQFAGGNERQRRCRGSAGCRGSRPSASTSIRIDAIVGEDSLAGASLPANGVVAARAINRGQLADTMYNMRPGTYENYLIVLPVVGGSTASWRLEELATTAGARSHRTIASGTFRGCNHQFLRGPRADFKTCAEAGATRPASFGATLQDGGESPIWIGCAEGCCTADPGLRG
jgi:hypothetical protein